MSILFAFVDSTRSPLTIVLIAAMSVCSVRLTADDFTWEAAPASSNWDNPNNWSGPNLQIPDDNTDTALVDTFFGLMPTLTANRTVGELTIHNGADVFTGNGAINFSLLVQNNGGASGTVTIDGLSDQFRARLEVYQSPAAIDLDTDQLVINDFGTLRIRDNAFVQVDQSFRTEFHVSGSGSGTVSGNSITTARIDLTGILNLAADSTFNMNGGSLTDPNIIFESATFGGSGDLIINSNRALQAEDGALIGVDVVNRGRFEPGLSIGLVQLAGNFGQANSGTFAVELAGTPVVDHDLLNATGTANLDGRLIVKLIDEGNGFPALQIDDDYTILTADGGVIGQFDNNPISIANGVGYQWQVIYNPNDVVIRVDSIIPNLVLGDINGDGVVTLLDVAPFVNIINSGTYNPAADINCDGVVNLLDVNPFVGLLTGG